MLHKLCLSGLLVTVLIQYVSAQSCSATYNKVAASFVPGGTQQTFTSLTDCQNGCASTASCTAIDWDSTQVSTKQCYFFFTNVVGQTILASLVNPNWIIDHYDLTSRSSTCNIGGSNGGGVVNNTSSGGGNGLPASPCTAQWSANPSSNVANGLLIASTSLADCQTACFNQPTCTGVDFDTSYPVGDQCFLIYTTGLTKSASASVTHYDITRICPFASTSFPVVCPPTFQPHQNVTIYGGTAYSATTPELCKAKCVQLVPCYGVVFDTSITYPIGFQCFLILSALRTSGSFFVPLQANWAGVTFYKIVYGQCSPCNIWLLSANVHILGGKMNPATTVTDCQTACNNDNNNFCYSIDFDNTLPVGTQCYLIYTPTTTQLIPAVGVNHYDRGGCGGTGTPLPTLAPNPNLPNAVI